MNKVLPIIIHNTKIQLIVTLSNSLQLMKHNVMNYENKCNSVITRKTIHRSRDKKRLAGEKASRPFLLMPLFPQPFRTDVGYNGSRKLRRKPRQDFPKNCHEFSAQLKKNNKFSDSNSSLTWQRNRSVGYRRCSLEMHFFKRERFNIE